MKTTGIAYSILPLVFLTAPALGENNLDGAKLFEFHGCNNCHGADAKTPISKVVPSLTGKSADELYTHAKKILSGEEGATEASKLMHAALYSPSQCDSPPTDEELHAITAWIAQL